jgi:pyruvate kinase
MNAVRINSAHVTPKSADRIVNNTRRVSESIAIIIDTKGPEVRVTRMAESCRDGIVVKLGDRVRLMGTDEDRESTPEVVFLNVATVARDVPMGASVLVDDGEIELVVVEKGDDYLIGEVKNAGVIRSHKSVNIPGVQMDLPSISERDRMFILWAIDRGLDFVAHSFVRTKEDVLAVKKIIKEHDSPMKIISKIENKEGVDNLDKILPVTYGIMVARGDLGVELPAEKIPVAQRLIVRKCIESKTPVIIATQMLHSMISNPRPTRAEVSDIAGAVYERVDAIMLSGETANGDYPVEAVSTMTRVAMEIERDNNHNMPLIDMNMVRINNEITAQLSRSAVRATLNLPVRAIVTDTLTGRTGRYLAAFRSHKPVYAFCYSKNVMRQLALSYGVYAIHLEDDGSSRSFLPGLLAYLREKRWLTQSDLVVVIGGSFGAANGASFMNIGSAGNFEKI